MAACRRRRRNCISLDESHAIIRRHEGLITRYNFAEFILRYRTHAIVILRVSSWIMKRDIRARSSFPFSLFPLAHFFRDRFIRRLFFFFLRIYYKRPYVPSCVYIYRHYAFYYYFDLYLTEIILRSGALTFGSFLHAVTYVAYDFRLLISRVRWDCSTALRNAFSGIIAISIDIWSATVSRGGAFVIRAPPDAASLYRSRALRGSGSPSAIPW